MPDERELLKRQVRTLEDELRLKDEYIAFLHQNRERWERGLQRSLDTEHRRAAVRDRLRRIPVVGRTLVYAKQRYGAARRGRS